MVRPSLRSRSKRRIRKRVPGGASRIHYVMRRRYRATCPICGRSIGGVPRDYNIIRWGPKTAKRPERYFGGVICSNCLATVLKLSVRSASTNLRV